MTPRPPTALIADDEPLLRDSLARMLAVAWPELEVVACVRNGREAVDRFEALRPDVCFLDVHMPGMTGVEAARHIGHRAHLVFVTAYDQYAVQAFAQGVLDYLVKPVEAARLAETVARLQERLRAAQPASNTEALLRELAVQFQRGAAAQPLRWIRASIGTTVRLIAVESVDFLRATDKYTLIAWRSSPPMTSTRCRPSRREFSTISSSRWSRRGWRRRWRGFRSDCALRSRRRTRRPYLESSRRSSSATRPRSRCAGSGPPSARRCA